MSTECEEEVRRLRQQIQVLLAQARANETKQVNFKRVELRLISADNLHELFEILLVEYPKLFALEACSLQIDDSNHHFSSLLDEATRQAPFARRLRLINKFQDVQAIQKLPRVPYLCAYHPELYGWLLPGETYLKSMAILPLTRGEQVLGSLCFGSSDPTRFTSDSGTIFLQHLAAIVSVCFENAINREILKRSVHTDPLTQVKNRRFFDQRINEEINRTSRSHQSLSLMLLDVDFFKKINDGYGHQAGDEVLVEMARRFSQELRASDVLARYGGEEFVVLLPDSELPSAEQAAERIRRDVERDPVTISNGQAINVTVSIGVSSYRVDHWPGADMAEVRDRLVEWADVALYAAKEQGRNRVMSAGILTPSADWFNNASA